ncbi:MAG: penicillin-binding protein 2 [Chloroflexi bacterium]|nr:penicillin-binding protein 2 [Chloroflexota bacterium]MQC26852.1 penicillin-binding protein 2 [Chloroflexota bacterium]
MSLSSNGSKGPIEGLRVYSFLGVIGLIFVIFTIRLFNLQVVQYDEWLGQAEENRIQRISLAPQRGVIYDRNGIVLARNIASYNINVIPANLPDDAGEIMEIELELADVTGVPFSLGSIEDPLIPCGDNLGVTQMVSIQSSFSPFDPVSIQCDVPRELALAVAEMAVDWPGVEVEVEPVRDFPTGDLTAAVIGFLGPIPARDEAELLALGFVPNRDKVGYGGLELYFDELLRGLPGSRLVETDVAGQILRDVEPPIDPVSGQNVILTIDTRLQQAAQTILTGELNFWNTYLNEIRMTSGVVIAINPRTGEILAMVSWPSYENNRMARFIPAYYYEQLIADSTDPLVNHAAGAELPAGSVFKLVTAVGALNEKVVTPEQIVQTPAFITITEKYYAGDPGQGREFVDWNDAGFGQLNFNGGIANSSNVYFYKLGGGYPPEDIDGLGICRLGTYANALGYGLTTGIELPYETEGLVPTPTWKRRFQGENWSTGDTYIASVGQGFDLATPLQVLMSAAVIANDGAMMQPTLVREIVDGQGNIVQSFEPQQRWDITQDKIIKHYTNPSGIGACEETGELTSVEPWVIDTVQQGMRSAVQFGTLAEEFQNVTVTAAGKTGTAEYCDEVAFNKNLCIPGNWPTHAWTVAYAPYENPEIAVVAFVYNGGEGASVAGPIVVKTIEAYFELKAVDSELGNP